MNPEQERKLDDVVTLVGRIDERTEQMEKRHESEINAAHKRITEVRGEARQDVDDLRGEVKRLSGLISAGISAVIAGGAKLLGIGGG